MVVLHHSIRYCLCLMGEALNCSLPYGSISGNGLNNICYQPRVALITEDLKRINIYKYSCCTCQ